VIEPVAIEHTASASATASVLASTKSVAGGWTWSDTLQNSVQSVKQILNDGSITHLEGTYRFLMASVPMSTACVCFLQQVIWFIAPAAQFFVGDTRMLLKAIHVHGDIQVPGLRIWATSTYLHVAQ
jgi:hypothetical protein